MPDEDCQTYRAPAQLPHRVGIAIVDHDDNVLENGPYFNVGSELNSGDSHYSADHRLASLVRPMLERYARRAGVTSRKQNAEPQRRRKEAYDTGDIVALSSAEGLPRIAEVKGTHHGRYVIDEIEGNLMMRSELSHPDAILGMARLEEIASMFECDDDMDDLDDAAKDRLR